MTADRKKGILSASAGSVFWGSSGIAGQFLLINENIAPEWLTFFRLFCAGFLLLLLAHFLKGHIFSIWQDRKDCTTLLIFSIFGMLGTQYGYFASIRYSNAPPPPFWNISCLSSSFSGTASRKNDGPG